MSPQYGELRRTSGWDRFGSLGHPSYFQWLPRLGSVTARQSSSERQPNYAALNRARHLCSAGQPSRWALAHISSFNRVSVHCNLAFFCSTLYLHFILLSYSTCISVSVYTHVKERALFLLQVLVMYAWIMSVRSDLASTPIIWNIYF